jgi:hypothetical protein
MPAPLSEPAVEETAEAELVTPRADAREKTDEMETRLLASDSEFGYDVEVRRLMMRVGSSSWPWKVRSWVEGSLLLEKLPRFEFDSISRETKLT